MRDSQKQRRPFDADVIKIARLKVIFELPREGGKVAARDTLI